MVDDRPFQLLLAYTSARNFLIHEAELHQRGLLLYKILHRLDIANRGSWGEVHFTARV